MLGARHLTLLAALVVAAPVAQLNAQQPWGPSGSVYGPYAPRFSQIAQDEGYRRGVSCGENDRRRGAAFNFTNESDYRRADVGYRSAYGSRDSYREDFRIGFAAGYREGYGYVEMRRPYGTARPYGTNRYGGGYYSQSGRGDLAFDYGYNDGYEEGLNDGRKRHRNDPLAESRYRSANHGYDRYYGPVESYRLSYRAAFTQGYERGFTDGWSYR